MPFEASLVTSSTPLTHTSTTNGELESNIAFPPIQPLNEGGFTAFPELAR